MATHAAGRPPQTGPGLPGHKILRIGIVQGGRIVEERLVRTRENITIGQSAKNLFVVPSETLPREWMLFQATPKGYVGHFADAMDARIAVGNEVISLSQLKQTGKIRRHGQAWVMLLDERSRGKIAVGDMTVLFQFVTPPPPQPRPQLPASVRGSFTNNLDWFFTTIAAVSFLAHLALVIYLRNVDWPRKPDIETIPDRFVQMVVKKQEKPPEPIKVAEEKKADDGKKEEAPKGKPQAKPAGGPKKELSEADKARMAEEKARADAERRARLADAVRNTGILKLLGAKADGEGSIADVLGKGDVDRDQEAAFKGVGGLTVATGEGQLRGVKTGTGGSGKVASVSGLRGGGGEIAGASIGNVGGERAVKAVVKQEAPAIDGELDPNIVAKEVRARIGAIKACYERALKRNPNLSGKVVIHWTITPAGTVSGVDIEQDTLGDSEVTNCIKQLVSRWRFPAPSGGAVEVSYPFVFQSSQ
jgi:outer membrane biosynthesis protein TonB